ncbi:hypothetical protein Scep_012129 [Stephania cephalantha]|uniref:U-box domain-containing protein n=1 Tax=Stephania cephalantha TaxID=152367 RepID=A0AAP0JG05_9MAGN
MDQTQTSLTQSMRSPLKPSLKDLLPHLPPTMTCDRDVVANPTWRLGQNSDVNTENSDVDTEAFAGHALTLSLLVKIILKVSDRATEYAGGVLLSLCSAAEEVRREAMAARVVTLLLLLLQSECTE